MRLSVPQALLSDHLQSVAKAVPGKSSVSVLEGILLESNGESLTITATNLELGIRTSFPVAHQEPGKVVLPSKIVEIIRRLPGESVQISVHEENFLTEIKSGQSEFQLYGLSAEEFPVFPEAAADQIQYRFQVEAGNLKRALKQTLFAVSHDEGKPAFNGVLFTFNENVLYMASSDTFRLATTSCPVQFTGEGCSILVPAKNLQEVVRIFGEDDKLIEGVVVQNQLLLICGEKKVASRLLDENFPNVERVIPKEFIGKASVDVAAFLHAVERASLLSEGLNHILRISIGEGTMVIRAASKHGKIQETVALQSEGEGLEISLNARFVIDMLKVCEGDQCTIKLTGSNKPCILKDSLHEDYLYLVLPIKA
jgi:DNA polymerase-3 subunit beta